MKVDVVVPAIRKREVERLILSLALGTVRPRVLIVSNEVDPFFDHGLDVRILGFTSDAYCYGEMDVALRQNVGIFWSDADAIIVTGDDQIAPERMVESSIEALQTSPIVWGNHRYVDTRAHSLAAITQYQPGLFRSRENPEPPAWHGWQSCYGGMLAADRKTLQGFGGFDMAFNCRHAGEDQQLGRRIALAAGETWRVFIHEPPFAWIDEAPTTPWRDVDIKTNSCRNHRTFPVEVNGVTFHRCNRCPYQVPVDETRIYEPRLLIPYDPKLVTVTERRL